MPGEGGRVGIANIGYERRTLGELVGLLLADGVRTVVDVRADPISRRPDFRSRRLREQLEARGLDYVHVRELGVPAQVRRRYDGKAGRGRLLAWYGEYIDAHPELVTRVARLARGTRLALLCYEREPADCHRGVLSDRLRAMGLEVDEL
jgi:uncharacterized protein (DUF488 family)